MDPKPAKPRPDFPLFPHSTRRWAKKIRGRTEYFGPWSDPAGAEQRYNDFMAGKIAPKKPRQKIKKPSKPQPDFPLFAHASGRWAKKVRGTLHYFGRWDDPQAALEKWLAEKDELLAGRRPRASTAGVTVKYLCNHFLTAKERKVEAGELKRRTWVEYRDVCEHLVEVLGRNRVVLDLRSEDFGQLRAYFAKGRGVISLRNQVARARVVFRYGHDADLIDRPVKFGAEFKAPDQTARRRAKQEKPARILYAAEIRALLDAASVPMRAMILLGINCGLGNTDCSELKQSHLDLDRGILDFPRPKTAIERRAALWPETVKALREAIAARPTPRDPADDKLVFITERGHRFVRFHECTVSAVSYQFGRLLAKLGIERQGVSFYALRHSFETVAGSAGDQPAVDRAMGHTSDSMAENYTHWRKDAAEDARLRRIAEHVWAWLFATPNRKDSQATPEPALKSGRESRK